MSNDYLRKKTGPAMRPRTKDDESAEIERLTAEFLAKGNQVEEVPVQIAGVLACAGCGEQVKKPENNTDVRLFCSTKCSHRFMNSATTASLAKYHARKREEEKRY